MQNLCSRPKVLTTKSVYALSIKYPQEASPTKCFVLASSEAEAQDFANNELSIGADGGVVVGQELWIKDVFLMDLDHDDN